VIADDDALTALMLSNVDRYQPHGPVVERIVEACGRIAASVIRASRPGEIPQAAVDAAVGVETKAIRLPHLDTAGVGKTHNALHPLRRLERNRRLRWWERTSQEPLGLA